MRTGFNESPLFEVDLLRARRFSEGEATIPEERLNFNPTDHEVQEYVDRCRTKGECGLDIETPETAVDEDDLDPLTQTPIELVGLSCDIGEAIGVRPDQFDLLRPLLEGPNERKVVCWAYNGGFDFYHLRKRYSLAGLKLADAMLSLHLLWPHLRTKDLATCLSIFTDLPYYKNLRKIEPDVYNARDTYGVLWAGQQSLQMLRNYGMESLFWNHMMPLIWVVDDWRVKGINTDQEEANRQILTLTMALNAYDKWWAENIPLVSWSSPKQLLGLFSAQGLPIQKKKRLQGPPTPSVDDDVLEMYVKKYKSQTALLVQMMRGLKHARDFYEMADEDGKIHARFKLHGQVGGRIQSVGANVQTIPEELDVANGSVYPRNIICPDNPEEDVIISADFSQIELWCYAWYSKDKNLLEVKESGDYVYGAFYEDIFEEPFFIEAKPRTKENAYPDVAPYKLLIAKSWPLGFIYGRGVPNPEDQGLPITRSKAKEIHNSFHHRYPQISIFHADLMYKASKQGYLQTVFGRLRRFPNPRSLRNEILAFPGQSTAVDILISKALLPFKDLTRFGPRTRTLFSVHDSVQVNAHKSNAVEVAQFMKATMESPIPEMGGFHIPVTIKLGPNWGQCTLLQKYAQTTAGTTPDLPPAA
jgi:DNA polymerase I-like protein with 3'-5' exonuclease and polymerase domains